jgi:hypothetical protein
MSNTPEYLVDQVQNVNVQGPLVTVTYGRSAPGPDDKASELLEKLQVTMTTPNFVNTVNALNQIVKRMSEQNKAQQDAATKEQGPQETIGDDENTDG